MPQSFDIHAAARRAMIANGFRPDVPADVLAEVAHAEDPATQPLGNVRDLRGLAWSSIDNDSSLDLDQIEVAERLPAGDVRVSVAIADVDATVPAGSATDQFAAANSCSVYTGVVTYPMLPDRLSTQLTSLVQSADRPSIVIEFVVAGDGTVRSHDVHLGRVENKAKLAYGAWAPGSTAMASSPRRPPTRCRTSCDCRTPPRNRYGPTVAGAARSASRRSRRKPCCTRTRR